MGHGSLRQAAPPGAARRARRTRARARGSLRLGLVRQRRRPGRARSGVLHLTEALLPMGTRSSASTASATTTRRAREAGEPRARRANRRASSSTRSISRAPTLAAVLDGCDVVFHLAAEPGVRTSWGAPLRPLRPQQRRGDAAAARGGSRAPGRGSSTRHRRRSTASPSSCRRCEDAPPRPLSPYGVTKLAGEQLCRVYHVNHGRRHRGAALLHRLRPAPAPRHGVPALLRGRGRAAARSSCSATAARAATSPTSPTSSSPSARPARARASPAAPTTSAAARRSASTPRSRSSPRSPAARSTCGAPAASRATSCTRRPTARAPARSSASRPSRRWPQGLRAEYDWVVERAEQRRGLAAVRGG